MSWIFLIAAVLTVVHGVPDERWLVTWREWEPDPAAVGWSYANICHTPGCHTVHHWGYHTHSFESHEQAIGWLNIVYRGDPANVISLRKCSWVPLQRKIVGNKTVERTVTTQESVYDEQWVK